MLVVAAPADANSTPPSASLSTLVACATAPRPIALTELSATCAQGSNHGKVGVGEARKDGKFFVTRSVGPRAHYTGILARSGVERRN